MWSRLYSIPRLHQSRNGEVIIVIKMDDRRVEIRVDAQNLEFGLVIHNAVVVEGDAVGETLYYGAGAGAQPTASAVVADLIDVVRTLTADPGNRVPHLAFQASALAKPGIIPLAEVYCAHYLRLTVQDKPGVLADITKILGGHGVSIKAIHQHGTGDEDGKVPVVIVTHVAQEAAVAAAVSGIEALPASAHPVVRIRLETLEGH